MIILHKKQQKKIHFPKHSYDTTKLTSLSDVQIKYLPDLKKKKKIERRKERMKNDVK